MPTNRSSRLAFVFIVLALLVIIGRNTYHHHQEAALESAITDSDEDSAVDLLQHGVFANDPKKLAMLLGKAIDKNEPNVARTLLKRGVNPNDATMYGSPALLWAVSHCPQVIRLLLDKGARVDASNGRGDTPLRNAVQNNDATTVKLLLAHGADVNQTAITGAPIPGSLWSQSALELAVMFSRSNALLPLLLAANPNQATKDSALTTAVMAGNAEIVRVLLTAGARPAPQSQKWLRALYTLHRECKAGQANCTHVLALLRPYGVAATATRAEIEAKDLSGQTALLLALMPAGAQGVGMAAPGAPKNREAEIARQRQRQLRKQAQARTQEAQALLAQGENVNVVDLAGNTPLTAAIAQDSPLVPALLERGANPNSITAAGLIPLQQAVQSNNVGLVKLLLAYGADPNLHRPHLSSVLDQARKHHRTEIVTLLQRAGAH